MYDPLLIFSLLLFSAFAVPVIADKTKVPGIVFYILAGVAFERYVFTQETIGEVFYIFAEVGKLYLMFIAGIEIDFFHFRKNAKKSVAFGVFTFIIPLALGTIVIIGLFGYTLAAALLTASFFASHTLLSLAIINRFGIGNSEPVSVVVGATIISDIAVLGLLAVLADLAHGTVPTYYWAPMFGGWVLFIAAIVYFVPRITQRVFKVFSEDGYAQFLFVFAAACLLSWAAHFLRLESLIGAFFCGLALCRIIPKNSILMTKINFVGNTLFIPFFFIYAGMLIDPKFFAKSGDALVLCVFMTIIAIAAKAAASYIFGKMNGYPRDAILMAAGMTIQQAATTIVCAMVGFQVGIIDEVVFNAAMLHILLTCTVGEVISVHYAGRYARGLHAQAGAASPIFESKTLVHVSDAASSGALLNFACLFRHYAKKYVMSPLALAADSRESIAEAETILGVCTHHANELEDVYRPEMRIANNVADGILRTAAETKPEMIVCPMEDHNFTLVDECPARLIFVRLRGSLSAANRVVVVFMPTSENRPDIMLLIAEVRHLAQQISARVVTYISENQVQSVKPKVEKFLNDIVRHDIVVKSRWNEIKRDLPDVISDDDAVILAMGARQKLFRLPSADKYPAHIASRFENNSVIAAYPPLSLIASGDRDEEAILLEEPSAKESADGMTIEPIETEYHDFRAIAAAVAGKLRGGSAPEPASDDSERELYDILVSSADLYPVELVPGTTLVHAHTELVSKPKVFLWHQADNHEIAPAKIAPNVLVIVLNPLHGDPQTHLKTLSAIAGIFMNPKAAEVIASCDSDVNTAKKLAEKLRALR